jgi:hypothetical protein
MRRSRFELCPNHSICMMACAGCARTATNFLTQTLGRNGTIAVTFPLTYVSSSVTGVNLARVRAFLETIPETERVRFPRAGFVTRSRAASGIMLSGIMTGAWGAATGLGQAKTGNARRIRVPGSLA